MFGPSTSRSRDFEVDSDSSIEEEGDIESAQQEFEDEMRQEMESHMVKLAQSAPRSSSSPKTDQLDESDELLYDPNADDDDEKWVENKRKLYLGLSGDSKSGSRKPNAQMGTLCPGSDAVLNCPGCMTVLCLDCQQHEIYKTQYRAMFVLNCNIDWSEKLSGKKVNSKCRPREGKKEVDINCKSPPSESDSFFNVRCSVCTTQVAVYDEDEVFHFFNVLSSYS